MNKSFFGLHDATNLSYNHLNVGSVRLWDVGVSWKYLEPTPGVFDFTRLDSLVDAAVAAGASITMVLGQTPLFYADRYTDTPPFDKWENYVRALATRYKGKIAFYQVWNEANIKTFFTGTPADMAILTRLAARAINSVDPAAKIVAPSGPITMRYMITWFRDYYSQIVDGFQPWRWINRVGFSMYPTAGNGPESMLDMLVPVRSMLDGSGMPDFKKVIHASEINYNVSTGSTIALADDNIQVGNVMRTYLVGALAGMERVHWYRYDWGLVNGAPLGDTYLTDPADHDSLTLAGQAFNIIKEWMSGSYGGYTQTDAGTYLAKFGSNTIAWNPDTTEAISGFDGAVRTNSVGDVRTVSGKTTVGARPVLLQPMV